MSNAYFLAKFLFDTAENEPAQNLKDFANFPNFANPNLGVGAEGAPVRLPELRAPRGGAGAGRGDLGPERGAAPVFGKFRHNVARFRLYRHRFLQENTRFAAFFKIYQIIQLQFLKYGKFLQILQHLQI